MSLGIVYFEETGEEREVIRMCKLCGHLCPSISTVQSVPIVSPTGIGHTSSGYGITDCGKDATGPDWWWRI